MLLYHMICSALNAMPGSAQADPLRPRPNPGSARTTQLSRRGGPQPKLGSPRTGQLSRRGLDILPEYSIV